MVGGWLSNARHVARFGHQPEWIGLGGLAACMKCVKGGSRVRPGVPWSRKLATLRMTW